MANKQRTHKSTASRFKVTASGKVMHRSQKIRHLKASKSKRRQRSLNQEKQVVGVFATKIKKLLGKA